MTDPKKPAPSAPDSKKPAPPPPEPLPDPPPGKGGMWGTDPPPKN